MIQQVLIEDPYAKILVCAASNVAVDEVALRTLQQGYIRPSQLCRVGRNASSALEEIVLDPALKLDARKETLDRARVVFATLAGCATGNVSDDVYDSVIVDEAGQATEASVLSALFLVRKGGKLVLVGGRFITAQND